MNCSVNKNTVNTAILSPASDCLGDNNSSAELVSTIAPLMMMMMMIIIIIMIMMMMTMVMVITNL